MPKKKQKEKTFGSFPIALLVGIAIGLALGYTLLENIAVGIALGIALSTVYMLIKKSENNDKK